MEIAAACVAAFIVFGFAGWVFAAAFEDDTPLVERVRRVLRSKDAKPDRTRRSDPSEEARDTPVAARPSEIPEARRESEDARTSR